MRRDGLFLSSLQQVALPLCLVAMAACGDDPLAMPPLEPAAALASGTVTVTDLGAFGTPRAIALDVNGAGEVVGRYGRTVSQRSFLWSPRAGFTDLGDFGGRPFQVLRSNERGDAAGWSRRSGGGIRPLVRKRDGRFIEIADGTLDGLASGLNNGGQVAGDYRLPDGRLRAFLWSERDGLTTIEPVAGHSRAFAVNERGQVAGSTATSTVCCEQRAFRWSRSGGMRLLGSLGGSSFGLGINDRGDLVGHSELVPSSTWSVPGVLGSQPTHAFFWSEEGGIIDLGTLGGTNSMAWNVDEQRRVTGWAENAAGHRRAFLWTRETGMIDLGTLGGDFSQAGSLNARVVVGQAQTPSGERHAVIWELRR